MTTSIRNTQAVQFNGHYASRVNAAAARVGTLRAVDLALATADAAAFAGIALPRTTIERINASLDTYAASRMQGHGTNARERGLKADAWHALFLAACALRI